jgi:hypothetical protein
VSLVPEGEWGEEPTTVYKHDPTRDGADVSGQSVDAVFERARRTGVPLPTAFIFSLYVQACGELAGTGRRPPRHKEDRHAEPELGPHRIFVGFDGRVKIDWAEREVEEAKRTRRSYLSPEQLRGLPTNGRSDLYSLALTIAELFVLKRLSDGRGAINESEGGADLAELLRSGTRIPRELGSMLLKSLALDVEQRPFGVTSLMEDLERIGYKVGLRVQLSEMASHMRRLFSDAPPPPVPSSPPSSAEFAPSSAPAAPSEIDAPAAKPTSKLEPSPTAPPPPSYPIVIDESELLGDPVPVAKAPPRRTSPPALSRMMPPPPPLPQDERFGNLDVFASLPKPGTQAMPQLLPPPIVEAGQLAPVPERAFAAEHVAPRAPSTRPPPPRAVASPRPVPPRPAPSTRPSRRMPESEPPPGLARTLPPPEPHPIPLRRPRAAAAPRPGLSGGKVLLGMGLAALVAFPFLRSGPGKVFTSTAGHWGEPLVNAVTDVDGEQKCTGPRCSFELSAGVHEVTVRAEGYVAQLQLVAVHSREPAAVNFRLERGGSALKIAGRPDGASVLLDGEPMGRMPLEFELTPGTHSLRFEAEHYLPEERTIDLTVGETKRFSDVALKPLFGKATLDVRTPGAEIALVSASERKDRLDVAHPVELDLSQAWTLEAKKWGYQILREPLDFGGGLEKTFVVALDKANGPPGGAKRVAAAAPARAAAPAPAANSPDALRAAMQRAIERDVGATPGGAAEDLPPSPDRAPLSSDPCLVSFNSIPVSNIYVDGVRIGVTPLLKARVRPGAHVVQFVEGDQKKSKAFLCKPGELKVVAISLNR